MEPDSGGCVGGCFGCLFILVLLATVVVIGMLLFQATM